MKSPDDRMIYQIAKGFTNGTYSDMYTYLSEYEIFGLSHFFNQYVMFENPDYMGNFLEKDFITAS